MSSIPEIWDPFSDIEGIDALSLELIFLTARYASQLSTPFVSLLKSLEKNNAQYGFLFPDHPFHALFNSLVQVYHFSASPSPDCLALQRQEASDPRLTLKRLEHAVASGSYARAPLKRNADGEGLDGEVQWDSFVVVGTIQVLQDAQDLHEDSDEAQDMEFSGDDELEDDGDGAEALEDDTQPPYAAAFLGSVKVIDRDQLQAKQQREEAVSAVCQICGLRIPIDEFDEHMRIELADPDARERARALQEKSIPSSIVTSGDRILASLHALQQSTSSGFAAPSSAPASAPTPPKDRDEKDAFAKLARDNALAAPGKLEEELQKHLAAQSAPSEMMMPARKVQRTAHQDTAQPQDRESSQPQEQSGPLSQGMASMPDAQILLCVNLPQAVHSKREDPDPVLKIQAPLHLSVKDLKHLISDRLGILPNKFKLNIDSMVLKDESILGNIEFPNHQVELSLRQRGGRRR